MGFFDSLGSILSDATDLRDEFVDLKNEIVTSLVDPAKDLTSVIDDIATDIKKN